LLKKQLTIVKWVHKVEDTILRRRSSGTLLTHTIPCSGMQVELKSAGRSNCLYLGTSIAASLKYLR